MGAATKTLKFADRERALSVRRETLNEESRTVDVIFATENPVESYHGEIGDYDEILDCTPEAGNLSRLNSGGQFLKEHSPDLVVGVIENARFENRVGVATLRYAKNPLGEEEWGLMRDGIRKNFSVRYRATLLRQEAVGQEGGNVFRAVAWEAKEISVVSVNADPKCQVLRSRADGETSHTTTIEMSTETIEKPAGTEPAKTVTIDENKLRSDIQAKLVKNIGEINDAKECFRKAGHDVDAIATKAINEGKSVDEFRADAVRSLNTATATKAKVEPTIEVVGERRSPKTLGQLVTEHDNFRAMQSKGRTGRWSLNVDLPGIDRARADFLTTSITGYNGIVQLPEVIQQGVQPLRLQNLLAEGTTSLNSVPYMKEDSFTPAATAVAEGAAKPEQGFALTQTSAPIKKIAAWTTMSDELLEDAPAVASYINGRLIYAVQIEEEDQLLNGSGVGANITGILNASGIQTQALGADTVLDAIYKAITKVRSTGFFEPDGIVIHPNDWQSIRLAKDGNNNYFGGGPFTGAYGTPQAPVGFLWGLPVVVTTVIAENTALVGAFKLGAMVWRRKGISVDMTNSNEDDFKNNLVTVRAEERLGLAVWRPKAFCTVTGI